MYIVHVSKRVPVHFVALELYQNKLGRQRKYDILIDIYVLLPAS